MPLCYLYTNIPNEDLADGMEERIAMRISQILDKPIERVNVIVMAGVRMYRQGSTTKPTCSMTISSIGVFDKERNPGYTGPIKETLMNEMSSLTPDRVFLIYHDLEPHMLGQ